MELLNKKTFYVKLVRFAITMIKIRMEQNNTRNEQYDTRPGIYMTIVKQ